MSPGSMATVVGTLGGSLGPSPPATLQGHDSWGEQRCLA